MILREYQTAAIDAVRARMREGHGRVVLVVPTGGGKTIIGASVVRSAIAKGRRVLWLAHRTELIDQSALALARAGLAVGVLAASSAMPIDAAASVQVASIQTLVARDGIRPPADLIVWDECHHASRDGAERWTSLLDAYPGARMLGLTATPERSDGSGLAPLFTSLVVGVQPRKLIELGYLVECAIVRPKRYLKKRGETGNPLAQPPVDAWIAHAGQRQGFLFAARIEEAERYARDLCERGVVARCVSERTPAGERSAVLDGFRSGDVRVLTNVFVFTEGTDLPMAEVCCLARGAATAGTALQMIGRVLRPSCRCGAQGRGESCSCAKAGALLLDLPGLTHVHGCPEDERAYRLDGRAMMVAGAHCAVCGQPITGYPCSACGYEPEARDSDAGTTVTGDALVRYARKIAEGPDQRWETLLRWLRAASTRGHKPASVRYKWRHVYGCELSRDWFDRGCAIVREENPHLASRRAS